MKKSLLAIAFAMVAMVSSAQVYVGGSLGFDFDGGKELSSTAFNVAPEVGYAFNENFAVGASFDYNSFGATVKLFDEKVKSTTTAWNFKPYVRYTFYNAGILSCFVDGVFNLSGAKDLDENYMGVNVCPGVALSITDNVSVVSRLVALGWNNFKTKEFSFNASFASFGVYYTF